MDTHKAKRVFVVDDEHIIATTLGLIFRKAGFQAVSYTNPVDLLSACEHSVPDAVISDVVMPQMTGIDLAVELRHRYPGCKVVLISGQAATSELLREAEQRGEAFHVLTKPMPPAALIEHVRARLEQV